MTKKKESASSEIFEITECFIIFIPNRQQRRYGNNDNSSSNNCKNINSNKTNNNRLTPIVNWQLTINKTQTRQAKASRHSGKSAFAHHRRLILIELHCIELNWIGVYGWLGVIIIRHNQTLISRSGRGTGIVTPGCRDEVGMAHPSACLGAHGVRLSVLVTHKYCNSDKMPAKLNVSHSLIVQMM